MATAITHVLPGLRENKSAWIPREQILSERRVPADRRRRRWIGHQGADEASRVPPEWHAWLHHTVDEMPDPQNLMTQPWQEGHQHN